MHLFSHNRRVCAVDEYGMGEPAEAELHVRLAGLDVSGVRGVQGLGPAAVEGDADLT